MRKRYGRMECKNDGRRRTVDHFGLLTEGRCAAEVRLAGLQRPLAEFEFCYSPAICTSLN